MFVDDWADFWRQTTKNIEHIWNGIGLLHLTMGTLNIRNTEANQSMTSLELNEIPKINNILFFFAAVYMFVVSLKCQEIAIILFRPCKQKQFFFFNLRSRTFKDTTINNNNKPFIISLFYATRERAFKRFVNTNGSERKEEEEENINWTEWNERCAWVLYQRQYHTSIRAKHIADGQGHSITGALIRRAMCEWSAAACAIPSKKSNTRELWHARECSCYSHIKVTDIEPMIQILKIASQADRQKTYASPTKSRKILNHAQAPLPALIGYGFVPFRK